MKKLFFILALFIMAGNAMSQTVCPPTATGWVGYYVKPVVNGQVIHTFVVCDPDVGDTHIWSTPTGNIENFWGIGGGILVVANATGINSGTVTQYDFVIRVTDNGTAPPGNLYAEEPITLIEQNLAPVIENQNMNVDENSAVGTIVGTVVAYDPNGQPLTYVILSGNVGNMFAINSTTGTITVADPGLNYEGTPSYTLVVRVTDNATVPLSAAANVNIAINNLNEAPVIID